MAHSTTIVAYLALFAGVGFVFLFVNLLVGKFLRPANPHPEKTEIYECGEPTIGSSFVQFDIRFYVVALLFIIFDVEVAFFFPWATVFGKSTSLMDERVDVVATQAGEQRLTPTVEGLLLELGDKNPTLPTTNAMGQDIANASAAEKTFVIREMAQTMAVFSVFDIAAFFAVLMVGFAYVWKRGDLDWVRAITRQRTGQVERLPSPDTIEDEQVLTA
jgi:NADH-quinone oxidoreductase subunit A